MQSVIVDEQLNYNLNEFELNFLNLANGHFNNSNNFNALHELHNVFYANLLRRIETFNIDYFLKTLNKKLKDNFSYNILKRWEEFTTKELLALSLKLNIINNITYNIFLAFHIYKSKALTSDSISEFYLLSYFRILKDELLLSHFEEDSRKSASYKRRQSDEPSQKRRQSDKSQKSRRESDSVLLNTSKINPKIFLNKFNKTDENSNILPSSNTTYA